MLDAPTKIRFLFAAVITSASWVSAAEDTSDHPLTPLLAEAKDRLQRIEDSLHDYTCLMIKRERVGGELLPLEYLRLKVRHQQVRDGEVVTPFSVYGKFIKSRDFKDREIIYVADQNHGEMIVRKGGRYLPRLTFRLAPEAPLAMATNRYPITDIGIQNLLRRLDLVGTCDLQHEECLVERTEAVKEVDGRPCNYVEVLHPARRPHFKYHLVRIYEDVEYRIPTRFEAYDWPTEEGAPPPLIEFYTYVDLKLNVGLTDQDFDPTNKAYGFFVSDLEPKTTVDVPQADSLASSPPAASAETESASALADSTPEATAAETTNGAASNQSIGDQMPLTPAGQ